MTAVISVPLSPLMLEPNEHAERADEVLFGWPVTLATPGEPAPPGWTQVTTHYRYSGYARNNTLVTGEAAQTWARLSKQTVLYRHCDLLAVPEIRAPMLVTVPKGSLLAPLGAPDDRGWQRVLLPNGHTGYGRASCLGAHYTQPVFPDQDRLRAAVVAAALSYRGTQYRWGGRTPLGIDCSGLCSMAYLLNGVIIYRDASIREGFPVRPIPRGTLRPGDLLYFPGHMALWLGEGKYLHATARTGSDGVVVNSLRPGDSDYREDLDRLMVTGGTVF